MDEALGSGWRIVLGASAHADVLSAAAAAAMAGMRIVQLDSPELEETDGVLAHWFAQQACVAAIVRPDHYVYGVAADADELSAQILELRTAHQFA